VEIVNFVQDRLRVSPEGKPVLVGMKCRSCGETMFPRERLCPNCSSEEVEEVALSSRGRVWSYTIVYESYGNFIGLTPPYPVAFVELPEGAYVHTPIVGCAPEEVRIGLEVELDFLDVGGQRAVYVFRPVRGVKGGS